MSILKIRKVDTLPVTVEASTMYMVKSATDAGLFDMYVTSSDGLSTRHIVTKAEIATMIANAMAAYNSVLVVANIAARNALVLASNAQVLVLDATGDPTVTTGAALYVYDYATTTWYKVSEYESLDVVLQWSAIQGKPTSTVAAIDQAVADSHTHANKALLDLLSIVGNHLHYNGEPVRPWLEEETW